MIKKILIFSIALFVLMSCASAIDSSNWTTATVGYEEFKIPPEYENPYDSDFHMYQFDEDIDEFTIRYVNPNIMDLYGYFTQTLHSKKVKVSGHDAVHFTSYDHQDNKNESKLWFSAGEEFYYIAWEGSKITPAIKEIVKSASNSSYSHKEFYEILNTEYQNYKIIKSIESQGYDYQSSNKHHTFYSIGTNGFSYGIIN